MKMAVCENCHFTR